MRTLFLRILVPSVVAVALAIVPLALHAAPSNRQSDTLQTSAGELRLTPLYHGSVMLECAG